MRVTFIFLIILFLLAFSACSRKGKSKLDPDRTYSSTYKAGNLTGDCRSCLIVEINEFSLFAVLSKANPAVETCSDSARYISDLNNPLVFPANEGDQEIWTLRKTQGGLDPSCFPDSLDIYVTKEPNNEFNFLFSHNTNEYTMIKQP